eukprot:TRINITY_DN327_c7_g1_i1.p1 TRINITY_DN327_c7_g1~~TRINITY_DN327_c7_g1_i1.p1  ORF type:complete len:609 (+),score=99.81 TRINITY_DN327_c7_g1_i1:262-1827(+)
MSSIATEIHECIRNRDNCITQKSMQLDRDNRNRLQRSIEESNRIASAQLAASGGAPYGHTRKTPEFLAFNSRFNGKPRLLTQKVRGLNVCRFRFNISLPDDLKTVEQFWSDWDPSSSIHVAPDSITVSPNETMTTESDLLIPKTPDHFVGVVLLTTKMAGQNNHPYSRLVFLGHNRFTYEVNESTKALTKKNDEMRCYGGDFDDSVDSDLESCARRHLLAQSGLTLPSGSSLRKFANFKYEERQSTYFLACLGDHKVTLKKLERTFEIEVPAPKEDKPKPSPAKSAEDGKPEENEAEDKQENEDKEKTDAEEADTEMRNAEEPEEPKTVIKEETVPIVQPCAVILSHLLEQTTRSQISIEIRMIARLLEEMIMYRQGKKLLVALGEISEKRKLSDSTLAANPFEDAANGGQEPGKLKRRKTIVETTDYSDRPCFEFFDKMAGITNSSDHNTATASNRQSAYRFVLASIGEPDLSLGKINSLIGVSEHYTNLNNLFVTTETDVQTELSDLTPFDDSLFCSEN